MTLAAVHIALSVAIIAAIGVAGLVFWYWFRLGYESVPASRRKIRRASLVLIVAALPVFVIALSVVDPKQQASAYIIFWSVALLLLLLIIAAAVVDGFNNVRLHREQKHDQFIETAASLFKANGEKQQERAEREKEGRDE